MCADELLKTISNEIFELGGNDAVAAIIQKEWKGTKLRFKWNDKEVAFLKHATGKITIQQIADSFGIDKNTVEKKLAYLRKHGKMPYTDRSMHYQKKR